MGNIGQENVFYDILEQKKTFIDYKNKKIQTVKKLTFSKGVNPWFWYINDHFSNFFFFRQYKPGKYLCDNLERKNAFQAYKNEKLKKSQT